MKSNSPDVGTATATAGGQRSPVLAVPRSLREPIGSYTVQQAAALTGLSEHTLRYYEKVGLIEPVLRQESSGHRRYSMDDLARLETLACLRATGMPIDQMRRYFDLRAEGEDAAVELQALLAAHLKELHRRMTALQTHIEYVESKIDYWRAVEAGDRQEAQRIANGVQELVRAMSTSD